MTGHNLALPLLLSVSDVTRLIRNSLEDQFQDVWIEGEISNLRAPSSGHLYFTLKDSQSQLRGVLFRSGASRLRFALQEGLAVIARGRISVYEPRGEYQLIVDSLDPKGVGAFQLAFEQLKERLSQEGLFDEARKRRLPAFPGTVGVVTSLTGAAIRDIVAVLRRRCPIVNILIAPVPVQGDGAGASIARAIDALSEMPQVEVLIVGRDGGASEDLWAFNDETVARAYDYVQALGKIPIVVNDSRGFYTSRTFGTFVMEGAAMLGEGIPAPVIENAGIQCGMPVGPLAVLDETDSGLDIDALRIVAGGVNKLANKDNAIILVTHYQRLLDYIEPDVVHVLYRGQIVKSGGKDLALELEKKGYDWIKSASAVA